MSNLKFIFLTNPEADWAAHQGGAHQESAADHPGRPEPAVQPAAAAVSDGHLVADDAADHSFSCSAGTCSHQRRRMIFMSSTSITKTINIQYCTQHWNTPDVFLRTARTYLSYLLAFNSEVIMTKHKYIDESSYKHLLSRDS